MTQENKELLLRDLCSRLPYGVKVQYHHIQEIIAGILIDINMFGRVNIDGHIKDICDVKPYLFPMSNMTEEQEEELITITNGKFRYMWGDINNAIPRKNTSEWGISENAFINSIEVINILYTWLLKNHFDINGLIPIGLANDATNINIY